ncbi:SDR family oxidoreductase [Enterovibrio makurazakiensis]|uniref:SDR family oxidoreductase n=1 Tax=Enterovibrio gelatinilyticus TaxID=2899819 RepID=A0ABT5R0G5_9GAMM|nr:SDR family oxidoreductase [Enterovibrio sp. ZSDZ42]MDD1793749.1 SDR family oxidoreductase [Enterovibrio sp. ZSDZ42]
MNTVLITGAARGIGLELVKQFLESGSQVFATYRGNTPPASLTDLLSTNRLSLRPLEVTDQNSIDALTALLEGISIDIIINNAGIIGPQDQSYHNMDVKGWLETFEINTVAPLMVTNALLPNLAMSDSPRVITISSQMGSLEREAKGMIAYRSSKAAVNKVMQVLALELKEQNITVCPVHPGWVKTDMGGDNADISVQESARGILKLARNITIADTGKFFTWEGTEHPW